MASISSGLFNQWLTAYHENNWLDYLVKNEQGYWNFGTRPAAMVYLPHPIVGGKEVPASLTGLQGF